MSKGSGWVKIDKNLKSELPNSQRPYTKLEAMFSFTCDQDEGLKWTIKGYSKLWSWSRNKVRRFVNSIRTPEGHPKDTQGTPKGHPIHFIDTGLQELKDTLRTPEGHPKDTPRTPTIKTKTKTKKTNGHFEEFWQHYPKKKNKGQAEKSWHKIKPTIILLEEMIAAISKAKETNDWKKENGQFIPYPASWLNAKGWEDEHEEEKGRWE